MKKSVMLSVNPFYCSLISSGLKLVEVRKTKPLIDVPFKCYVYCTKGNSYDNDYSSGKVIGHFICDEIDNFTKGFFDEQTERDTEEIAEFLRLTCLTYRELCSYVESKKFFGWHISDLVIYEQPKELSEFYVEGDCDCINCRYCAWFDRGNGYNVEDDCNLAYKGAYEHKSYKPIFRPPMSWCYVT